MELGRVFIAEIKKLKRTRALYLAIAAPVFVALLDGLHLYLRPHVASPTQWQEFIAISVPIWYLLMLSLYIATEMGLMAEVEHTSSTWKYLFSLPVSRSSIYLSKFIVGILLVALSNLILVAGIFLAGFILSVVSPDLGFSHSSAPNIWYFLSTVSIAFVPTLLIIAIHLWASVRFKSFTVPIGMGAFAVVGNAMALNYAPFQQYFPWIYPFDVVRMIGVQPGLGLNLHNISVESILIISIVGTVIVTLLALWDLSRKDII